MSEMPLARGRRAALAAAALALVLAAVGALWVDRWYTEQRGEEVRLRVESVLAQHGRSVSVALNQRFALLAGFRSYVEVAWGRPDFPQEFERFASGLQREVPGIRSLQYIVDGVIRQSWPVEGNEAAIGFNLYAHPQPFTARDLRRAETSRHVVLSGPLSLVQGGLGLTARVAARGTDGRLLAVTALVLDLPPVLQEASLERSPFLRLALADDAGNVFFGDSTVAIDPEAARYVIELPDRAWTLHGAAGAPWRDGLARDVMLLRFGMTTVTLLLVLLVFVVVDRQGALTAAIDDRTRSLLAANRQLADQIAQRERAEAQLVQMHKMEGLGRLAGGVAHDFNNLLTGILGYVSLLQDQLAAGTDARKDLDEVERAARRAADLTRQLLTFARRQAVSAAVVDVNATVDGLRAMLQRLIAEDVEIVTDLEPGASTVRIDPTQLEQVITNLVINAKDAMSDGGRITISTRRVHASPASLGLRDDTAPEPYVRLEVRDTGHGMDAATLAQVFEPFFTTKGPGQGTGLGLAICYGIVRQAGGQIRVDSQPGAGTTVIVHLPPAPEPVGPAAPVAEVADRPGGGERVLVVEDDPVVRQLAERALRERGYVVETASDGEEALERMAGQGPGWDLLLTDVVMPRKGGRAVADALRARHPEVPVVFMSGHIDDPRVREAIGRNDAAFLPKPFTPAELAATVREALDRAPGRTGTGG